MPRAQKNPEKWPFFRHNTALFLKIRAVTCREIFWKKKKSKDFECFFWWKNEKKKVLGITPLYFWEKWRFLHFFHSSQNITVPKSTFFFFCIWFFWEHFFFFVNLGQFTVIRGGWNPLPQKKQRFFRFRAVTCREKNAFFHQNFDLFFGIRPLYFEKLLWKIFCFSDFFKNFEKNENPAGLQADFFFEKKKKKNVKNRFIYAETWWKKVHFFQKLDAFMPKIRLVTCRKMTPFLGFAFRIFSRKWKIFCETRFFWREKKKDV
jgi:hypothetical protein